MKNLYKSQYLNEHEMLVDNGAAIEDTKNDVTYKKGQGHGCQEGEGGHLL